MYKEKYLKYKFKYLLLKQLGGNFNKKTMDMFLDKATKIINKNPKITIGGILVALGLVATGVYTVKSISNMINQPLELSTETLKNYSLKELQNVLNNTNTTLQTVSDAANFYTIKRAIKLYNMIINNNKDPLKIITKYSYFDAIQNYISQVKNDNNQINDLFTPINDIITLILFKLRDHHNNNNNYTVPSNIDKYSDEQKDIYNKFYKMGNQTFKVKYIIPDNLKTDPNHNVDNFMLGVFRQYFVSIVDKKLFDADYYNNLFKNVMYALDNNLSPIYFNTMYNCMEPTYKDKCKTELSNIENVPSTIGSKKIYFNYTKNLLESYEHLNQPQN